MARHAPFTTATAPGGPPSARQASGSSGESGGGYGTSGSRALSLSSAMRRLTGDGDLLDAPAMRVAPGRRRPLHHLGLLVLGVQRGLQRAWAVHRFKQKAPGAMNAVFTMGSSLMPTERSLQRLWCDATHAPRQQHQRHPRRRHPRSTRALRRGAHVVVHHIARDGRDALGRVEQAAGRGRAGKRRRQQQVEPQRPVCLRASRAERS